MANASLFMDVIAKDGASPVFNKIAASANQLAKSTDRTAKSTGFLAKTVKFAAGYFSLYGVSRFLKASVQEYARAEIAQEKLAISYRRFPKASNVSLQAIKNLNTAMQEKTRFDDDAAAAMQANLLRFNLTGKEIMKLTPLVMDLAEATGKDLVTAGSTLGKAFLGNGRALKALGINYEYTGKRAKDTANITDLLNKKVGGESVKANKTAEVQLAILSNQYGELKERIGQALMPVMSKLSKVAGPAITSLGKAIERNMPQIEQTFEDIWKAGSKVAGVVKNIWDAFAGMPPGVRDTLLAMSAGFVGIGKLKNSALGTGIGSVFSGLKTITAGNVTVIGKTVTGTPGGPGGKTGGPGILTALGGPVGLAAIVTAVAVAYNARQYTKDQRNPLPAPAPGGLPGLGNAGNAIVSDRNRASDAAARLTRQQIEAIGKAAQDATGKAGALATRLRMMPKPAREAAAEANKVAAAIKKAADVKAVKITVKGAKQAASDAENVANKLKRIQNRDARVTARGARQAAADAVNVANRLRAIPDARPKITVEQAQAVAAIAQVTANLAAVQSKTIYLNVVRNEQGSKNASGGYITGPGTATSDSIPAWLSNGEYVMRAAAVDKYGVGMMHRLNALSFRTGGYAKAPKKLGKDPTAKQQRAYNKAMRRYEPTREARGAEGSARLNQKLATLMASRGITDETTRDFLLSMSPRAAIKLLEARKNKRIGVLARKYASLNPADAVDVGGGDTGPTPEELAEKERSAQESVRAAIEETAASYRSFASIATTSVDDVTAAQEKLTTAEDAVTAARRKFDLAGNDRDRAAAARELADAEKNLTTAQKERNNVSDKVSAGSIRANMAGKLTKLKGFAAAVKQLKANGLNATTLADILSMGPDQGYDYAKALLDGGIGDLNALQADITATSADLGLFTAGVNSASSTAIGLANAAAGGLNLSLVPAPVTLNLNGREIATALLEYQRQNGG